MNRKRCMRFFIVYAFFSIQLVFLRASTAAEPSSWIDSTENNYSIAAQEYDMKMLEETAEFISQKPIQERQVPRALLVLGFIFWRQELIHYCRNDPAKVGYYGKMAIETLNKAEKAGADIYLTASHKALASQLLAAQSRGKGALYGPRAAAELKKARQANPRGYFSLLVEAINANQAPSFVGGNPKKAAVLLEGLAKNFPDSIDVKIHLSEAYIKVGRTEDARRLIISIITTSPSNLLAQKIAAMLPKK